MKHSFCAFLLLLAALMMSAVPLTAEAQDGGVDAKDPTGFHTDFHGYYRARLVGSYGVPVAPVPGEDATKDDSVNTNFVFTRLRLNPTFWYGREETATQEKKVFAALKMQVDVFDNVVFGDNARLGAVPLFAEDGSTTNIFGQDDVPVKIRRLWLEVFAGIGQIRIGRQPSNGGLGLLFNDGNGFRNQFGDAQEGSTFDRFLFATRPLAVVHGIGGESAMPKRWSQALITAVGYDWLVEDPLGVTEDPQAVSSRTSRGPFDFLSNGRCPDDPRTPNTNEVENTCNDDVQQFLTVLVWNDPDLVITKDSDMLQLGFVFVWRSQDFSDSNVYIFDAWWKFQVGLGHAAPSFYTEAEVSVLKGSSNGIPLTFFSTDPNDTADVGAFPITGRTTDTLEADILNAVVRVGLKDPMWDLIVEGGYASGDPALVNDKVFKMFSIHSDYKVGLLMYPVVLNARTANTLGGQSSGALRSQGSVWNSHYLFPTVAYRPTFLEGLGAKFEVVAGFLVAWANTLNGDDQIFPNLDDPPVKLTNYLVSRSNYRDNECDFFAGDCALGWELDVAIKLHWLKHDTGSADEDEHYMMRWSNEFGIMQAGEALAGRLKDDLIWTIQSRIAMVW